jgi:hypothetical protein
VKNRSFRNRQVAGSIPALGSNFLRTFERRLILGADLAWPMAFRAGINEEE